jgi:hypothetical protein
MPPVNAFNIAGTVEEHFPLNVYFCKNCTLIQLGDVVPPAKLFSTYLHTSSASVGNVRHLKSVAELLLQKGHVKNKRILEIGSNDGLLLQLCNDLGGDVLGVDPAANLSVEVANKGVKSLVGFFDESFAIEMSATHKTFDTIVALNVIAHTPTFISALKGVKRLLSHDGMFMMENAYVLDTVLRGQFDTIYHEHIFCFSLHSLIYAYEQAGLFPVDAEIIPTQGKSIRVYVKHQGSHLIQSSRLKSILAQEIEDGVNALDSFEQAAKLMSVFRERLRLYISEKGGTGFVGLGAPARGVVILNYCLVGPSAIEFIIDDTVLKQGKLAPGCQIPVLGWDALDVNRHHQFIILSWNYADDMIKKLRQLGASGTALVPFPNFTEIIL